MTIRNQILNKNVDYEKSWLLKSVIITMLIFFQFFGLNSLEIYVRDSMFDDMYITQEREEIILVLVGDETLNEVSFWPIPRSVYSDALREYFTNSKLVVFDFLFPDASPDDEEFAKTINETNNVVFSYVDDFDQQELVFPAQKLLESSAHIGYANYIKDTDGYTRRYRLMIEKNTITRTSLVYESLLALDYSIHDSDGGVVVTQGQNNNSIFKLDDANNKTFKVLKVFPEETTIYEFGDIVKGEYPRAEFDDKVILIGGSFVGSSDSINTPISPIIGVKYVHDSLSTVLSGLQPLEIPKIIQCIFLLLIIFFIDLATRRSKSIYALFDLIHICLATTLYFIFNFVFRYMYIDKRNSKLNISMEYILNMDSYLTREIDFVAYLEILNTEILRKNNLEILGVYNKADYIELGYKVESSDIQLEDSKIIIPIHNESENKIVVIKLLKQRKIKELNYLIALIISANSFFMNKQVVDQKNKMFFNIFKSLVSAIDTKDPITGNHSERVAEMSYKIGKLLGYSSEKLESLYFAGLIHDVGKIGINDEILNKPCFFNDSDFEQMKRHPVLGVKILDFEELDKEISNTILQHHEKIDGSGYPYGLKGDAISEFAKIVKIADVYDALSCKRQYKKGLGYSKGLFSARSRQRCRI